MKKFKKILWQNLVKITLLTSIVGSCAGIPGNNVKLENYSNVNQSDLQNIDITYKFLNNLEPIENSDPFHYVCSEKLPGCTKEFQKAARTTYSDDVFFLLRIGQNIDKLINGKKNSDAGFYNVFNPKSPSKCSVLLKAKISQLMPSVCFVNGFLSTYTLAIFPYYCQHNYQAQASLIHYPSESSLRDKPINVNPRQVDFSSNKIQIKQTKKGNYLLTEDKQRINEGEYFLDENNNLAKLLKTYELKDKVHEVWSSLWMLSWFVINPTKYASNAEHPKDAKKIVENNISEALVRSILNDAKSFPECQKNDDGKDRDQKNLSNK